MDLSEAGTENRKATEDVSWDNCVAQNFDIQGTLNKHYFDRREGYHLWLPRNSGLCLGGRCRL